MFVIALLLAILGVVVAIFMKQSSERGAQSLRSSHHQPTTTTTNTTNPTSQPREEERLAQIHARLSILHGNMHDEYQEQLMALKYIKPHHRVLEFGGNVGRNSLVIASILDDSSNLVTFECDPSTAKKLEENRDANRMRFHIETAALSNTRLQQKGWVSKTILNDTVESGWEEIATQTYTNFRSKPHAIEPFDVLVVDCEGCIVPILEANREILDEVELVLIENDFVWPEKLQEQFDDLGFKNIYSRDYFDRVGFYQTWRKMPSTQSEHHNR